MIGFFRKIRQNLVMKNRTGKYIKYAFGEIILVVIGILIALQINNWNELNKEIKEENRILLNLNKDIENDTLQLNNHIIQSNKRLKLLDSLMHTLANNRTENLVDFIDSSINGIGYENYFRVNSGTYDESVASGSIKFIRNDSLRQYIFNYYRDAKLNYTDNNSVQQVYRDIYPVFWRKLMATKDVMELMGVPSQLSHLEITQLARDKEFMGMILQKVGSEYNQLDDWESFNTRAKYLSDLLNKELNND